MLKSVKKSETLNTLVDKEGEKIKRDKVKARNKHGSFMKNWHTTNSTQENQFSEQQMTLADQEGSQKYTSGSNTKSDWSNGNFNGRPPQFSADTRKSRITGHFYGMAGPPWKEIGDWSASQGKILSFVPKNCLRRIKMQYNSFNCTSSTKNRAMDASKGSQPLENSKIISQSGGLTPNIIDLQSTERPSIKKPATAKMLKNKLQSLKTLKIRKKQVGQLKVKRCMNGPLCCLLNYEPCLNNRYLIDKIRLERINEL
jgi:hypothetical protein